MATIFISKNMVFSPTQSTLSHFANNTKKRMFYRNFKKHGNNFSGRLNAGKNWQTTL